MKQEKQEYLCPKCDFPIPNDPLAPQKANQCNCKSFLVYGINGEGPVQIKMWMDEYFKAADCRLDLSVNIKDNSWSLFSVTHGKMICNGDDVQNYWPFKDREVMIEKLNELLFWW